MEYSTLESIVSNYDLMESLEDFQKVSYAMDTDDLADFVAFLLLGDWSRNITVLDDNMQEDNDIIELFDYIKLHCES